MPDLKEDISKKEEVKTSAEQQAVSDRTDEIRSEDVNDILSHVPSWMIRWGITLIFTLILLLLFLSWLIKYPDIITGPAELTTENPAVRLVTNTGGRMQAIILEDGAKVKPGDNIAALESPLSQDELSYIMDFALNIYDLLDDPVVVLEQPDPKISLGALQAPFNTMWSTAFEYRTMMTDGYEELRIASLEEKERQSQDLIYIADRQIQIVTSELDARREVYLDNQRLYNEGIIGKMEFYTEEATFRQKEMELENLKRSRTELDISMANLQQEIRDRRHEVVLKTEQLRSNLVLQLNTVRSALEEWKINYHFVAPVEGELVHLDSWNEGQFIKPGTELFAVVPDDKSYKVHIQVPAQGYGKIEIGQRARIDVNGYPAAEYGYLQGTIVELKEMSLEGQYLATVLLDDGLKTTHRVTLTYVPEMTGTGQIVTEDMRLFQRLFVNIRKAINRE
ncbi:MAG TPA: hypothetical protein DDX92_07905 [Flavobacteriales bacterium]|jgi:multidrug efflux pump subunit AcrA (membrane-fusion protein)|nr:hypothetical protein [Flavobacteriales bacterium]